MCKTRRIGNQDCVTSIEVWLFKTDLLQIQGLIKQENMEIIHVLSLSLF